MKSSLQSRSGRPVVRRTGKNVTVVQLVTVAAPTLVTIAA
jgi:hypothetical protein